MQKYIAPHRGILKLIQASTRIVFFRSFTKEEKNTKYFNGGWLLFSMSFGYLIKKSEKILIAPLYYTLVNTKNDQEITPL